MGTYFSDWTMEDVLKHYKRTHKADTGKKIAEPITNIPSNKKSKYKAARVQIDGFDFDSKREGKRYTELKALEKAGKIKNLRLQVPFELQPKFMLNGKTIRKIEYVADFVYEEKDGEEIVEDTKGMKTDVYRLKKKLFEYKYKKEIRES